MSNPTVEILLLSYNQEVLLGDLLDSLLAQTWPDWQIIARDNGSSDGSFDRLTEFCRAHPQRMRILTEDRSVNLGVTQGFSNLLTAGAAPYSMLCDCDDVWLPIKIERTLECMRQLERRHGADSPLLVHTDLRIADASLTTISDSFCRYQNLNPRPHNVLSRLLIQNHVTGCTVMINKPLRDLALPIPHEAMMHDGWLALSAAALGHIGFVPEPTILYRQHGRNMVGARAWNSQYVASKAAKFYETGPLRRAEEASARQAAEFLARYEEKLTPDQRQVVRACISLPRVGWLARRARILRYGLFKHGLIRNASWLLRA